MGVGLGPGVGVTITVTTVSAAQAPKTNIASATALSRKNRVIELFSRCFESIHCWQAGSAIPTTKQFGVKLVVTGLHRPSPLLGLFDLLGDGERMLADSWGDVKFAIHDQPVSGRPIVCNHIMSPLYCHRGCGILAHDNDGVDLQGW